MKFQRWKLKHERMPWDLAPFAARHWRWGSSPDRTWSFSRFVDRDERPVNERGWEFSETWPVISSSVRVSGIWVIWSSTLGYSSWAKLQAGKLMWCLLQTSSELKKNTTCMRIIMLRISISQYVFGSVVLLSLLVNHSYEIGLLCISFFSFLSFLHLLIHATSVSQGVVWNIAVSHGYPPVDHALQCRLQLDSKCETTVVKCVYDQRSSNGAKKHGQSTPVQKGPRFIFFPKTRSGYHEPEQKRLRQSEYRIKDASDNDNAQLTCSCCVKSAFPQLRLATCFLGFLHLLRPFFLDDFFKCLRSVFFLNWKKVRLF